MATLHEAATMVQRLHGIVEQMALAVRNEQSTQLQGMQLRRAGTPLVGMLKAQFGTMSDQVAQMILIATRGGSEKVKVRSLRESVASLRTQVEIAMNKVKEQHMIEETDVDAGSSE
jgi:hypothetical protein